MLNGRVDCHVWKPFYSKYRDIELFENVAVMHDLHLIHTDLKPENVLLVTPDYIKIPDYKGTSRSPKDSSYYKRVKSSAVKVIDFGSTTYERADQNYIVLTRHYRAPEVILGLGWSYPCEVWSVGCILVELCSGEALFQTHENLEHLAMMERVLGPLPQHMLKRVDRHAEKYVIFCASSQTKSDPMYVQLWYKTKRISTSI